MSVFNVNNIQSVQFGVCLNSAEQEEYVLVPVDWTVQGALKDMVKTTAQRIGCFPNTDALPIYEHSEKYASQEFLRYPVQDDDAGTIPMQLFNAANIATHDDGLADPTEISFYFAICKDARRRKLVAIRRAVQFKGVFKAKGRLIRWLDDTMKVVEDDVFKLDEDFDYLVTSDEIYILRPNSFVYTADLMERVLAKAEESTQAIAQTMTFVEFGDLTAYVKTHPRAARLVTAIRSRDDLDRITKQSLKKMCDATGIQVEGVDGKLVPPQGQEMHFLYLLDRRRYSLELVPSTPETYEASSRRKV